MSIGRLLLNASLHLSLVMDFWVTALGASVGVVATGAIKLVFDHFTSGASLNQLQQDDDIESIISASEEVRDRSIEYWEQDDKEKSTSSLAGAIGGRLLFIGAVIDGLFADYPDLRRAVNTELNRFDSSVTHGNFGVANRKAEPQRAVEIETTFYSLRYSAQKCRRRLKRPILKP